MHCSEIHIDRGSHEEYDVERIGKALFVDDLVSGPEVVLRDDVAVELHLDFVTHLRPVRVEPMQEKLARAYPAGIQIAHLSQPGSFHFHVIGPWREHAVNVKPCGSGDQQTQDEPEANLHRTRTFIYLDFS